MGKREFEIGEVFDLGLVKLKCVKAKSPTDLCRGCVFEKFHECGVIDKMVGPCTSLERGDGNCVIFIKQDQEDVES